jgi:hypothetical protein
MKKVGAKINILAFAQTTIFRVQIQ